MCCTGCWTRGRAERPCCRGDDTRFARLKLRHHGHGLKGSNMLTRIEIDGFKSFERLAVEVLVEPAAPFTRMPTSAVKGARSERVQPAIEAVRRRLTSIRHQAVALVPIREMEARAICDGDALRLSFGVTLNDQQLGVPRRAQDVETIADPKATLEASFVATRPSTRHARRGAAPYLGLIGEAIAISRLQQVPAFAAFERELGTALVALKLLPG